MLENRSTDKITREDKSKAAEIARLITKLPEQEQEKIYYMLKGSEIFNARPVSTMPRAASL